MTIEGIPDGWELVRVGIAAIGEFKLSHKGEPKKVIDEEYCGLDCIIIRKIEKPKQYRPFDDPAEASSLIGEKLRLIVNHKNIGLLIGITSHGFQIGLSHWTPKEAFESFERLDGTPFGVEVTE